MKKVEIIDLVGKKNDLINLNKKAKLRLNLRMIIFSLLIVFIIVLFFNNFKLYKKTEVLNKEIELLNKEKEVLNITNKFLEEKIKLIKDREIFGKYKFEKEYKLYRLLCPKEVIEKKKVLFGEARDGAYVLLDDLSDIKIAYSFGISNMVHFDQALANKGIDVYMYDHTINKLPYENPKFHWKKIGIACKSKRSANLKTLIDLMTENGHLQEKNMILKMDIEGNGWEALNELTPDILKQFKYILLELHFWLKIEQFDLYLDTLKKLLKDHQIFHIHCCNCGSILDLGGENPICQIIEVSYIKREGNQFKKDESIYPIKGFDYKICPYKPSLDKENNILKYCDNSDY
jgi:cell division protein FtsB